MVDAILAVISTVLVLAVVYGLVFWAWRAKTDRSAIVGIYLLFGLPAILLSVAGTALVTTSDLAEGPFILASGLVMILPLIKPFRKLIASFTPMDPASPIDLVGLEMLLLIGTLTTMTALANDTSVSSDGGDLSNNPVWLFQSLITFVAAAYLAVGYRVHRTGPEATERLGLKVPDFRTIMWSVAALIPCFIMSGIGGILTNHFQPEVVDNLNDTMDQMTRGLDNPLGAVMIGLTAGIGEEMLMRGAVQPRYGILLAALFWTTLHVQYDLTFVLLGLFGIGIVLGLQRKYLGTTSAIITHALFNIAVVLLGTVAK